MIRTITLSLWVTVFADVLSLVSPALVSPALVSPTPTSSALASRALAQGFPENQGFAQEASPTKPRAQPQYRPTSGDLSIFSGRTMGNGETAIVAGTGFPGTFVEGWIAPSSRFNVGLRAAFLYASPLMGFGTGLGAEVSVPFRLHLFARSTMDVALHVRPFVIVGEGALVGQELNFADNFGYGIGFESTARAGFQIRDRLTLTAGAGTSIGYVDVPDAGDGNSAVGTILLLGALEANLTADLMLFLELYTGYGFARGSLFDKHGVLRASLGVAYAF